MIPGAAYDVYGGWQPTTLDELLECEQDPYITEAGVMPDWVLEIQAAARECPCWPPGGTRWACPLRRLRLPR